MREVAERMEGFGYHWHQSVIAKIETGQRPIRLNEATDLATLYGVALADLLNLTADADNGREVERRIREQIAAEIIAAAS